ncbi:carboxypeptidase M32 (plasmid) [Deinococcus aetherius]|uniref:Metal-dependent carboxypeptidase n=1 Tax=Deinococcus aetherius TaxID=200252 RepID=A0ABN6RL50_9DEIO|nr:carboxypeptidase M32 [Deinococcus aetherius]BDP44011.1 carboxypeptidase M32 [Deinococcus aetherius]
MNELNAQLAQINDLLCVINVLNWDARTQMPPGGTETRGSQLATVSAIAQERLTSLALRTALEEAEANLSTLNDRQARAVRQTREAVDLLSRIPEGLTRDLAETKNRAQAVWVRSKGDNDFAAFAPELERMVDLNRRLADAIGYEEHPYDALVRQYEPGMTAGTLRGLFAQLRAGLLPLLNEIRAAPEPRADFLTRDYPEDRQRAFALEMAQAFGYDLTRGRLDASAHPFEISFTRQDVRITTRYRHDFLPGALFGTLHETGHALYEQNVDPALTRTVLASDLLGLYAVGGASYGTHESQSRLWENRVGRSRAFWAHHFPRLQEVFPEQLADVTAEEFWRAVNRVRPSLIRVEADEVTYDLHIMLRVELEMALIEGSLSVRDLPEAWNAKVQEYLGVTPPDFASGVLQDIHWSAGLFGSFPTYTVGNVMASQFYAAARKGVPGLEEHLARGEYGLLREWLTEHVYRHGRTYSPTELLERATGEGLDPAPYLAYLRGKYAGLYHLTPQGETA